MVVDTHKSGNGYKKTDKIKAITRCFLNLRQLQISQYSEEDGEGSVISF